MTLKQILKHYGGAANVANLLGITPQAVGQWSNRVPRLRQLQIQQLTGGALVADCSMKELVDKGKAA